MAKKKQAIGDKTLFYYDDYLENIINDLRPLRGFLAMCASKTDLKCDHDSFLSWEAALFNALYALTELIEEIKKLQANEQKGA